MSLTTVQLSGTIGDGAGGAASGTLTFAPSSPLTDITDQRLVRAEPIPVSLSQAGTFTVDLYPTDNADLVAQTMPWYWNVTENLDGLPPYSWSFYLATSNGGEQDISSLTEITPGSGEQDPGEAVWSLTMPQGSAQNFNVRLTVPWTSLPFPVDTEAWQYVVRSPADDGTGTPLIGLTPTANSDGVLTVTSSDAVSLVNVQMYAAATQALEPGTYSHSLWEYPGDPAAVAFFTGQLIITEAAQPAA